MNACQSEEEEKKKQDDDYDCDNVLNGTKRQHKRTVKTGEYIFLRYGMIF